MELKKKGKNMEHQTQPSAVDSFTYECQKQLRLKEQWEQEGFTMVDDPSNLYEVIGTVQEIECFCEVYTPRLLTKLFVAGTESLSHSFHLVSLWQIVKFGYLIPEPDSYFTTKYVIGVRKVGDKSFIPSLRLPLN
jgi:hypothetical protein